VFEPFGVFIVARCTLQKWLTTVPVVAMDGRVRVVRPVNGPVSNETPSTTDCVKRPGLPRSSPSGHRIVIDGRDGRFRGGRGRFRGEKLRFVMGT